jgi:hypothetical protein
MMDTENKVTRNLLQFCYECADAAKCTTENACVECWTAFEIVCEHLEEEVDETQELLRLYAQ